MEIIRKKIVAILFMAAIIVAVVLGPEQPTSTPLMIIGISGVLTMVLSLRKFIKDRTKQF